MPQRLLLLTRLFSLTFCTWSIGCLDGSCLWPAYFRLPSVLGLLDASMGPAFDPLIFACFLYLVYWMPRWVLPLARLFSLAFFTWSSGCLEGKRIQLKEGTSTKNIASEGYTGQTTNPEPTPHTHVRRRSDRICGLQWLVIGSLSTNDVRRARLGQRDSNTV
eukprot:scaffold187910_cov35-Attheya_sp.AAC.2